MGKRESLRAAKLEEYSSSREDKRKRKSPIDEASGDDEANEDLSLKIVQKSMQRVTKNDPPGDGVLEIFKDLKEEKSNKEKKKRRKNKEAELPEVAVDNVMEKENLENDSTAKLASEVVESNPIGVSDNSVLRKLLRGPRYFDPPDNSWGACYNCGEEGHTNANCTSARRKKPCFVCGSFEHNAKQCSKGRDCFICKQQGHRAKDCLERNNSSKICLKCGDFGHEMFSCRSDYCPDDLKEIQCFVCGSYGHLCCKDYGDPGPRLVSCYRCGLSGHTGPACSGYHGTRDTSDKAPDNSCYKCGAAGHFARECISSRKASKRNHEPSTPKHKSPKKKMNHLETRSVTHDNGKTRRKKTSRSSQFCSGGWTPEDHEDLYSNSRRSKDSHWRSPATPRDGKVWTPYSNGDYALNSHSSKKPRKINFQESPSNGSSSKYYQHRHTASRFSNYGNGYGGSGRNNDWW